MIQKHLIIYNNPMWIFNSNILKIVNLWVASLYKTCMWQNGFPQISCSFFHHLHTKELHLPRLGLIHKHHPTISECKPLGLHYFHKDAMEQSMHSIWIINIIHQLVKSMIFQSLLCCWLLLGRIHRIELCLHL